MLRRVQFRWLLPLIMTAAQLGLVAWAVVHEQGTGGTSGLSLPLVRAAVFQEDETVGFQPFAPAIPPPIVMADMILNLPAMMGGLALAGIFGWSSDTAMFALTAPFVPLVWYPIGRWVDEQIAPARISRKRLAGRIAQWVLRVLAVLGIIACLFSFQGGWEGQKDLSYIPVGLWCSWYLFCSFWGKRRLRRVLLEEAG